MAEPQAVGVNQWRRSDPIDPICAHRALPVDDSGDTGKVGECLLVGGHNRPVGSPSRRSDEQVVCAAWAALLADCDEALSVFDGHIVVGRDHPFQRVAENGPTRTGTLVAVRTTRCPGCAG